MSRKYRQLSVEERVVIMVQVEQGCKLRAIARSLQRAPSTISREINRNQTAGTYRAPAAQQFTVQRRRKPVHKLLAKPSLWALVQHLLQGHWSPQQISGRLQSCVPDPAGSRVSFEAIYRTIYAFSALAGFRRALKTVSPEPRQTLTYDRGSEMARHQELAQ